MFLDETANDKVVFHSQHTNTIPLVGTQVDQYRAEDSLQTPTAV